MAEPVALASMDQAERQELKEAVCDALLERTRKVISGDGGYGEVVLGERPSRVLSSGFVLPRLNVDGDDESSDIRIAAHGMDLRLRLDAAGRLRLQPTFAVYVRALPTAAELFARDGRLIPPADFNAAAKQRIRNEVRARMQAQPPNLPSAQRAAARAAASREVMAAMGVVVPAGGAVDGGVGEDDDVAGDGGAQRQQASTRLRIPSAVSRVYEVPQKWVRVEVPVPPLDLALPPDGEAWRARVVGYRAEILAAANEACRAWIASPDGQSWAWRQGQVPSEAFWDPRSWDAFLAQLRATPPDPTRVVPPLDIQLLVDAVPDVLDPSVVSVRFALENIREGDDERECGIFSVRLDAELPAAALVPMRLERVRRSYHLAGFLSMPAVGVNGGVEDLGEAEGLRRLRTTWMPRYVLPRVRATSLPAVPVAYAELADPALDASRLGELPREMVRWLGDVERTTRLVWPGEGSTTADEATQEVRFRGDVEAWRREASRVAQGVEVLVGSRAAWREDPQHVRAIPYRAWLLLNEVFAAANPSRGQAAPSGWRLFQLAFVLAHVPTLASRVPGWEGAFDAAFDEDAASLLYMSTGGGKTEAFFGTIVYALFLDRLRGKRRGVTAMMHYPLRLLTIQQAQRLARLLAHAELVRRRANVAGAPFEIGFWVGGSNTPNRTEYKPGSLADDVACVPTWQSVPVAQEERLTDPTRGDKAYVAARDAWNKLPTCPFCSTAQRPAPTVLRLFPERHQRLGIVCSSGKDCPWNAAHGGQEGPEPLPFLLVDTDIYRRAPAVLLGTIDKLALLGQNTHTINRIAGMFGLARFVEGGDDGLLDSPDRDLDAARPGYEQLAPSWANGREIFHDPFPSLVVQDELHLLDESLGTFGGVFETGLFAWLKELAGLLGPRAIRVPGAPDQPRLPHVIGATATAADAAKHVSALYQKRVVQFPHPGPGLHEGFYTRLAAFPAGSEAHQARTAPAEAPDAHPREREAAAPWARVYASVMTNGRLHTMTTLSVLTAHAATVTRWLRDLSAPDRARQERAAREIAANVSHARWAERRRAAVARAAAAGRFDALAALVDLHRIELTYVTNKKGGDQILSAIGAEVTEAHAAMGPDYELADYRMELISGGIDVKGIQTVIREAEGSFDPMQTDVAEALRGIVATSAISHGVDVEAFNAMAFAGMPSDIAEYIQASSRVGRTHVGFSLLVPTPQARRDRFVVGVHETFHRLLERMIAPPAVERWADRALERTIPSLVQTWLAGIHYQRAFVRAPTGAKSSVRFPATVESVDSVFKTANRAENFDACVAFVQSAVGIGAETGGPVASADYYRDLVLRGVRAVQREVASGNFTGKLLDFWENDQNPMRAQRPMLSLRDVDEAGRIVGASRTHINRKLPATELAAAMAFLRNRGVARGRNSARSETDGED